ncbi:MULTISPECIES: flagellar hook-length control protein FliK [Pseudoalteromonas]|uniref:flagellar hook-length control protein FliK n=1 Tax=Pseudoalteromonas TaxID=53246 RepID=UPI00035D25D5|nr:MULTISPECIES: flagellar hook-length control protein FliK [Pseudoalteromonas]MCF6145449.1 hypothetical protein [Pseudoalteromonas mariniglutinosa NCIMB 1770]
MNKPTQITLANSLSVSHSSHNATAQQIPDLSDQTLSAKNIVFTKGSVQMEVYVDKHWQTLRLATTESQSNLPKIASADIQLSQDGKQLSITPKQVEISLRQTNQLQSLLNFINTGEQVDNKPLPLQITLQPVAKLVLTQLQASVPINKEVAQLLHNEQGLKAIITANQSNFTLSVVNRFADTLHQQPISQAKLVAWLSKLVPHGQLTLNKNTAALSFNNYNGNIKLATKALQSNLPLGQNQPDVMAQKVQLTALNEQLIIKTQQPKITLQLKNSLATTFNSLLQKSQQLAPLSTQTHATIISPSLANNSPISSWLKHSFADLKTRVTDAVRYFESKPFNHLSTTHKQNATATPQPPLEQPLTTKMAPSLLPKSLTQINLSAMAARQVQPLVADISQGTALPKHFHQSPPLVQLFQQLKAGLASITTPVQPALSLTDGKVHINSPIKDTLAFSPMQPSQIDKKVAQAATQPNTEKQTITTQPPMAKPSANSKYTQPTSSIQTNIDKTMPFVTSPMTKEQTTQTLSKQAAALLQSPQSEFYKTSKPNAEQSASQTAPKTRIPLAEHQHIPVPKIADLESKTQKVTGVLPLSITAPPLTMGAVKAPITDFLPASQISLPLEAKLLAPLLRMPIEKPLPNFKVATHNDKQHIAAQIDKFATSKVSENIDLNRLVNQAFSRMIDSQSLQPLTIQREILSVLRPESLSASALQNSFSQALEQLTVGILAAPSLAHISALHFNSQSSLDALLQVLVPNFKATNSQKLQEQLLQPQSQALAAELSQIKTAISQVNSTPINQQPDTNPLVQFLLPMRLPPEAAQTEISLGQYKKPSKEKLEGKNVWFVRLNFDYAELGQLQITAELMDKALDCQLLASSQDVTALAHPHLESLRHKLTAHGLQVGEMTLSQGAPQHQAFYQSHAIINIKV